MEPLLALSRRRDFGRRLGAPVVETGWEGADGSMGRGWVAVVIAVLIAGAGVLIAADRARLGRLSAVLSGTALVALECGGPPQIAAIGLDDGEEKSLVVGGSRP